MDRSGRHCRTIRTMSADVRRSHAFPQRSARTPSCLSALRRSSSSAECTTSRLMPACSADCTTSPKSAFETPTTRTDAFAVTIASRYPHTSAPRLRQNASGVRGVLGSWYSSCVPIIGRKPSVLNPCRTHMPLRAHEKPGIMIGQGKRNLKQEKLEKPPNIEEVFVLMLPGA